MKQTLLLAFLLFTTAGFAQKQAWNWYFGQRHALDFSKGDPVYKSGGPTRFGASYTTISDSAGRLLFYTDRSNIYDASHSVMQNGDSIVDVVDYQGMVTVPKPGSSSMFYVFAAEIRYPYSSAATYKPRGFRYSIVDMCRNSGLGAVIPGQKGVKLRDTIGDRIAVCADAAGTGYWILSHEPIGNRYLAWHLTSTGLSAAPVVSAVGSNLDLNRMHNGFGNLQLSPLANKLAMTIPCDDPDVIFEVCDFNNSTGVVSKPITVNLAPTSQTGVITNLAFSPQGRLLYVSTVAKLLQFDAYAGSGSSMRSSQYVVWNPAQNLADIRGLQLGPDGKLYFSRAIIATPLRNEIGRVRKPDVQGAGCDLDSIFLTLPPTTPAKWDVYNNFPLFVAGLRYSNAIPCVNATGIPASSEKAFSVSPNPAAGTVTIRVENHIAAAVYEWQLVDVSGRILRNLRVGRSSASVDLQHIAPGFYFYRFIENGTVLKSGKLIHE